MKSIPKITILALLTLVILSWAQTSNTPDNDVVDNDVGRYQLFQGEYEIVFAKDSLIGEEKKVFKIDTITGNTWILFSGQDEDGYYKNVWFPIDGQKKQIK